VRRLRPFVVALACSGVAIISACAAAPAALAPVPATTPLRATLDSIVTDSAFRGTIIGVLVVDAETRDTLYAHNAHTALVPASNTKIATGAVALAHLGPDYRFRTTFALRGNVRDGVLTGDLLVFGRGDPSVSQRLAGDPLAVLAGIADSLRARGVTRIDGRLVHAGDAFPGPPWGIGWQINYLGADYGAGIDELVFNEGRVFVPEHPTGGDTTTAPAATHPAPEYMAALRFGLQGRGVAVSGPTERDSTAVVSASDITFDLLSPPLSVILPAMEQPSQNQIAELVFRTLALEATGAGSDTAAARIVNGQLAAWGADTMQFVLNDGSGLSRHNLMSPATVVRILLTMRGRDDFQHFYWSLPGVGRQGTVRTWLHGTRASEVVRGKTGALNLVRAFSGYATSIEGRPIVFSFISNHHLTGTPRVTSAIQVMLRALTEQPLFP
jgi:serine-type D-Ala-D-Ala carboxypeptidase/endopeptidase (penicillin-binding protein 4)